MFENNKAKKNFVVNKRQCKKNTEQIKLISYMLFCFQDKKKLGPFFLRFFFCMLSYLFEFWDCENALNSKKKKRSLYLQFFVFVNLFFLFFFFAVSGCKQGCPSSEYYVFLFYWKILDYFSRIYVLFFLMEKWSTFNRIDKLHYDYVKRSLNLVFIVIDYEFLVSMCN